MKNLSLFVIGIIFSFSAFAQKPIEINFCGRSVSEVNIQSMIECKLLSTNNADYKVTSYQLGFITGKDYMDVNITDNTLTELAIELIKKHNPTLIYIEQIVAINKQGKKINVESFKVKK